MHQLTICRKNTQTSNQAQVTSSQGHILKKMCMQMESLSIQLQNAQDTIRCLEQLPQSTENEVHLPTRRVGALREKPHRSVGYAENTKLWINDIEANLSSRGYTQDTFIPLFINYLDKEARLVSHGLAKPSESPSPTWPVLRETFS